MQPVNAKQVAVRLAVGAQNRIGQINEMQPFVGFGMGMDEAVNFTDDGPVLPTGRCRCDRDVIDGRFWQSRVDILDERKVPIKDLLRGLGFGPGDIIGAGKQHNRSWMIGRDNPIHIVGDLMNSIDLQKILWKNSTGANNEMDVSLLHRWLAVPRSGGYIHGENTV